MARKGAVRFMAAAEAVAQIPDEAVVGIVGAGGGILEPTQLIQGLADRFAASSRPRGLTLYHTLGLGDRQSLGLAPIAQKGLVKRAIGGHFGQTPAMSRLAEQGAIEAFNLPAGVLSLLLRETAGGRPGLVTKIGMGTFVDPRVAGGRLNDAATDNLVEVLQLAGQEWLFYPAPRIDVALVRGWIADEDGNLSLREEPSYLDVYALAAATRASAGTVLAQVKEVVPRGSIHPKDVHVPAVLVDVVVEVAEQWQTYEGQRNDAFAGHVKTEASRSHLPLDMRGLIARRAALELTPGDVVNLGVGVPDGVASVLEEEGVQDAVTFSVEHGIFGGVTAKGHIFGATRNHSSVIPMTDIFDFYHSGGLDAAFLGFAQADRRGNVNVSKFGGTVMGTGGFIDITQHASTVVFCGTLTARGLDVAYPDHRIDIRREGSVQKFVEQVDQITFSAETALRTGQRAVIVTERAVFELREGGLTLTQVVEGTDVQRDVVEQMAFAPLIADDLGTMPQEVVSEGSLGLAARWGVAADSR